MTLASGAAWGVPHIPMGTPQDVDSDPEALRAVTTNPAAEIRVAGGDMARTLGSHRPRPATAPWTRVPIDLIDLEVDGRSVLALAHVVLRRRDWRGRVIFICNAEYVGGLDIVPRAHPGDGRLDLLEVRPAMSLRARLQARRRARTGTHLPHPDLRARQIIEETWEFPQPLGLWVDGVYEGRARRVAVRARSGAAHLLV